MNTNVLQLPSFSTIVFTLDMRRLYVLLCKALFKALLFKALLFKALLFFAAPLLLHNSVHYGHAPPLRAAVQSPPLQSTIVPEGFKGGTRGTPILPRDVSVSDSKCWM